MSNFNRTEQFGDDKNAAVKYARKLKKDGWTTVKVRKTWQGYSVYASREPVWSR